MDPIQISINSAPAWQTALVTVVSAIIGGVLGGVITWLIARRQMSRAADVAFVSSIFANQANMGGLASVFQKVRESDDSLDDSLMELKERIEKEPWFELLTYKSPQTRNKILKKLCDGEGKEALNLLKRLLAGRL